MTIAPMQTAAACTNPATLVVRPSWTA